MTPILSARDVSRVYDSGAAQVSALAGVDFEVGAGEFVALMGPSGSGKSTLLQLLGGFDRPTCGQVLIDGVEVSAMGANELAKVRNTKIGFVFQTFNLLADLTAAENVMLPAIIAGVRSKACLERAAGELLEVGLADQADRLPTQLSGGQRQRVAIARALVMAPSVVLADEPTGNLDSVAADEVMDVFSACHRRGQSIVLVTHDATVASRAERIVHLHDGRVVEETTLRQRGATPRRTKLLRVGDGDSAAP